MQRLKILIGASVLVLVILLVTTSSILKPVSSAEPVSSTVQEKVISTVAKEPEETVVDKKIVEQYQKHQQELNAALNAYFKKAIVAGDIVGAGVSIVKGDSILISDGFGKRSIKLNDEVNEETIFRLGSLSKGFAGVLAANLKNEGILDWNDRVSDYLPEFQLGDKSNTDRITLSNILSHTSGTPYHSFTNLVEAGLPMESIAKRFKEVVPISEPGILYSYQNAMFALCGEIMQKATGQKITTSLKDKFFKPLGMYNTTMDYEALAHEENVAMPHSKRQRGWNSLKLTDRYYNAIVAGGINASALDMAKWMRFLLGHNPELMNTSALKEAFNPFIEIKGGNKYYYRWPGHLASYYAFGWRIHKFMDDDSHQERTIWHHGGSVNNYRNEIAMYPEEDLGICVLLNSNSRLARTVIPDLRKIVEDIYGQRKPAVSIASNETAKATSTL